MLLPDYFEWVFVNADYDCQAAAGVSAVYPGPYLSFYNTPYTKQIADAHEFIEEVIEQDGPFDAIMGFSQGAALAASYLFKAQARVRAAGSSVSELGPAPFRLAMFICSSLPFSTDDSAGVDITTLYESGGDMITSDIAYWKSFARADRNGVRLPSSARMNCGLNGTLSDTDLDPTDRVFRYHPAVPDSPCGLQIPTVHVYGRNDPYRGQSMALEAFCRAASHDPALPDMTYSYEHPGGHTIPTLEAVSRQISGLVLQAVTRSELMF
ncbi:serine hydrolase FSH [Aspergillus desertorum]